MADLADIAVTDDGYDAPNGSTLILPCPETGVAGVYERHSDRWVGLRAATIAEVVRVRTSALGTTLIDVAPGVEITLPVIEYRYRNPSRGTSQRRWLAVKWISARSGWVEVHGYRVNRRTHEPARGKNGRKLVETLTRYELRNVRSVG